MAEKRTIELEIQDNSKSLKQQYREAVQELQKLSQQYGETSEQAVKAAKAAAELKDQIEFSKDLIAGFNPDAKFTAVEGAINGVMNGFQAFEGGLALIGVESEKVEEALLRVQSVMALTQGINGVMEAADSFSVLGKKAGDALKGIKTGLLSTGIGAFVVALGTVVAYWDDIKGAVSGVSAEQEKLNKKTSANLKASEDKVNALNKQDNILKLQGKSEKDILNLKVAALDTAIQNAKINVANQKATKIAQVEAAKRNKEILEGIIMFITIPIQTILGTIDAVSEGLAYIGAIDKSLSLRADMTNYLANLVFDPVATANEGDAAIKAAEDKLTELIDQQAAFKIQIKNIDKEAAKGSVNTEKAAAKETLDLERQLIDQRLALMSEGEAKEKAIAEEKAKRDKEDLLKSSKDKIVDAQQLADAQKLIDDNLQKDLQGITDKYDKIEYEALVKKNEERIKLEDEQYNLLQKSTNSKRDQELFELMQSYDAKFEAAKNNAELEKALTEQFEKEQTDIIKKYAAEEQAIKDANDKKELERKIALRQKTLELAGNTFSALADLAGSFNTKNEKDARKQFQIQKAFNLGAAITNTAMAVTGALTAGGNPIKLATGQQFVEAAIAATIGAANIIKIANSKFGGGGSSSSGGGGGSNAPAGVPMTANFNTIGSSGINQLAQLQQTPTQAYVVSGEVTSAQALDRNRVQNATL
jgi:hypothetical protein